MTSKPTSPDDGTTDRDPAERETPSEEPAEQGASSGSSAPEAGKGGGTVSRRRVFGTAGISAAVAGLAGLAGGYALGREGAEEPETDSIALTYPFRGDHQAGILTPAQDNLFLAAFDVAQGASAAELKALLTDWTTASEQMCAGELVGGEPNANEQAAPRDTGETWGYKPNGLTITFGFGASLLAGPDGEDRFGIKDKMPALLATGMPRYRGDQLRDEWTDGDIIVQACSNDPQVCAHAVRNLARIGLGTTTVRWSQAGYGRTSSTSIKQETPRNLFGFKDGTNNIKEEDPASELNEHLWVQDGDDGGDWLSGGSYLMARRIHMTAEIWDNLRLREQQETFGRDKRYGAPLSHPNPTSPKDEFIPADYEATGDNGKPLIPTDAHIAVVAPEQNSGRRMLRRSYNFTDGYNTLGLFQTGLMFIAFVRDPAANFFPILSRMTQNDALMEYLQTQGSGMYVVPAGVGKADSMIGQRLFE